MNVNRQLKKGGKSNTQIERLPTHNEEQEEHHTSSTSTAPPSNDQSKNKEEHGQEEMGQGDDDYNDHVRIYGSRSLEYK